MTRPINKSTGLIFAGLLLLAAGGASLAGQDGGAAQEKQTKKLEHLPMPYSDPASGAQMYKDYCAACHGPKGVGDGPAVEILESGSPRFEDAGSAQRRKVSS
jgi:mono/diheme cytochrome c family protein